MSTLALDTTEQKATETNQQLSHRSAAAVVVQVHERPSVSARLLFGVDEGFGKVDPVVDVVAAAAPVELAFLVLFPPSLVRVAVARLELPLAAGAGQCVHHARRGDGVDEGRFATAWECRAGKKELRVRWWSSQSRPRPQRCYGYANTHVQRQEIPPASRGESHQDLKVQLTRVHQARR